MKMFLQRCHFGKMQKEHVMAGESQRETTLLLHLIVKLTLFSLILIWSLGEKYKNKKLFEWYFGKPNFFRGQPASPKLKQ